MPNGPLRDLPRNRPGDDAMASGPATHSNRISPPIDSSGGASFNATLRRTGMILGFLLLAGAVAMVIRQRETLHRAMNSIQHLPADELALHGAVLIGSVLANIVLSGTLFSLLISRYGKVGRIEMQGLIASATLMNYIPLRPGFFGRLAYHKAYNSIALRDSVKAVMQAIIMSAIAAAYLSFAAAVSNGPFRLAWLIALPPPVVLVAAIAMKARRVWLWAATIRYVEVLIIAMRYSAAFALLGSPIDARGAVAFACISVLATMIPFLSNGLGLREWVVGLMAPVLTNYQMELGVIADLVNRAAEILVALPAGLIGMAILARIRSRRA